MKVAIAADGQTVASHFGRCEGYELAVIEEGEVVERERIDNPGHEPGRLPKLLSELEVDVIVAGGMGPRAQGFFEEFGIQTITGVAGSIDEAIEAIAWGRLMPGDDTCHHTS